MPEDIGSLDVDVPATSTSPAGRRPRVPAVLREEPQFRRLFAGQLLSVLGDRVTSVVLPFAVLAAGGGVRDVAVVSAAQFLPFVVLALVAGVWADKVDRRRILIVSDLTRLASQAMAATLLLTGHAAVAHLAVLAAVYGAADAFFAPAFTGLLPATVSTANLQPANALRGLTFSTGYVVGPLLAGALVAGWGPGGALLFDAATFVVSVGFLLSLRPRTLDDAAGPAPGVAPGDGAPGFVRSVRDGWAEVAGRSWLRGFLAAMAAYHALVLPAIFVLGPVLVDRDLHGARSWAIITAGYGLGSVLGDLLMLAWRPRFALRTATLMLAGASCQAAFIGSGLGVWGIAGLELLAGVCVTGAFTLWGTSLQEHVPSGALSRVASYDYLTSSGLIPVGNLAAGAAVGLIGLRPSLLAMSALGVTAALAALAVPALRHLPRAAVRIDPAADPV